MNWSETLIGAAVALILVAVLAGAAVTLFAVIGIVLIALLIVLIPGIVVGFVQGWREERKAEDSNPNRRSDPTG